LKLIAGATYRGNSIAGIEPPPWSLLQRERANFHNAAETANFRDERGAQSVRPTAWARRQNGASRSYSLKPCRGNWERTNLRATYICESHTGLAGINMPGNVRPISCNSKHACCTGIFATGVAAAHSVSRCRAQSRKRLTLRHRRRVELQNA
jgi:hypothetical protein